MTEIFISYKKEDARRAEPIARALANAGYEVWWDHHIPPGRTYREVIGAALSSAKCVIVIWSTLSASAQWVLDEADEGKKRNVLLPLLIDDVEIPYGFRQIEAARLVGWSGDTSDPEWINMLASVSHFVGRAPGGPPRPFAAPSSRESPRRGAANAATGSGSREQRSLPWGPVLGVVVATALVGGGGYAAWRAGMFERQRRQVCRTSQTTKHRQKSHPSARWRADACGETGRACAGRSDANVLRVRLHLLRRQARGGVLGR